MWLAGPNFQINRWSNITPGNCAQFPVKMPSSIGCDSHAGSSIQCVKLNRTSLRIDYVGIQRRRFHTVFLTLLVRPHEDGIGYRRPYRSWSPAREERSPAALAGDIKHGLEDSHGRLLRRMLMAGLRVSLDDIERYRCPGCQTSSSRPSCRVHNQDLHILREVRNTQNLVQLLICCSALIWYCKTRTRNRQNMM